MAEAVKNNGRKRRPPAHFNQVYNEDKYEGAHGRYYPSRTIQSLKQQNRQKDEPLNISQMAKLFSKFINSVNKKAVQFKDKIKEQQVQMMENKAISDKASLTFKNVQGHKDEQQKANSKKKDNIQKRDQLIRQQATKQKYQQKNQKKLLQNQSYSQQKNLKAQPLKNDSLPKNIYPTQNRYSIDEMAKASRQQYIKSLQKGVDPNIYKHKQVNSIKQSLSKPPSLKPPTKQQIQPQSNAYFRQTGKLFKRASFHIGIAYNIHIQNLKQHYPNFTPQQLDPTYYSRKLKILSEPEIQKIQQQYIKNNKIKQQMYKKQMEQKIQQQRKQTPKKQQFTQKNNHLMNSFMNNNKQLNCIDLIDQEPDLMIQQNKSIQERNLIQENKKEENIIDKNNQIKKEQQIQQIQQQGPNQEKSQEIN